MRRIRARFVGERASLRLGRDLAPAALQSSSWFTFSDGVVTRLDQRLVATASRHITGAPNGSRLLHATDDLSAAILATDSTLLWRDDQIVTEIDGAADSALFLAGPRLVLTIPRRVSSGRRHDVLLVDASSGRIVDMRPIDVDADGVALVPHPDDGQVLLDAGEGQDGSTIYVASVEDDRLSVTDYMADVVVAGFAPSGDRLLITPHPSFDDAVSIVDWRTRGEVARLSGQDAGLGDDRFDLYGCFVGERRVLLMTDESGVLLCDAELHPTGWIDFGGTVADAGQIELLIGLGMSTFAVETWRGGEGRASVWSLD